MPDDVQKRLAELWPPYGLVVTAGALELRPIRDVDIPDLVLRSDRFVGPRTR